LGNTKLYHSEYLSTWKGDTRIPSPGLKKKEENACCTVASEVYKKKFKKFWLKSFGKKLKICRKLSK
jgi:hypothetical protein